MSCLAGMRPGFEPWHMRRTEGERERNKKERRGKGGRKLQVYLFRNIQIQKETEKCLAF